MKKTYQRILLCSFLVIVVYACKKEMINESQSSKERQMENIFFTYPAITDSSVIQFGNEMKKQNDEYHF